MALALGLSLKLSALAQQCGWPLGGASVDLNFAQGRYYGGSLASISTTRASTGYAQTSSGLLVPFASNVPRITDNGLLVEEARTNLALRSQEFDNASWTKNDTTITADAVTAPDGTLTADKIVEAATTAQHTVTQSITIATVFTFSAYFKAAERTVVWLYADHVGAGKYFNLGTGAVGGTIGTGANITASSITPLANGWYRCTVSYVAAGGAATVRAALTTADGTTSYLGVAGSGAYVWGLQVEAAAFGTSYIPTTTASATRAADVITLTGAALTATQGANGWIVAQTNTLVNGTGTYSPYIVAGDNVNNNTFVRVNTATTSYSKFANTVLNSTLGSGAYNTGRVKTGVTWSAAGRSSVANNGTVATDANAPTSPTTVYLGSANGTVPSNGLTERITIGTSRLADATIKALTA